MAVCCLTPAAQAATPIITDPVLIYQTGFEKKEGFTLENDLAGQLGWVMDGTGGNGFLVDYFPGRGSQAYIGFTRPTDTKASTSVWKPLSVNPVPAGMPVLHFSVEMEIVPSTNGRDDDFRWSVYSTNGTRFFSLDFSTRDRAISAILDDGTFADTATRFEYNGTYKLELWMNFARNTWSMVLNGLVVVSGQRMAAPGTPLTFGDIDAVWVIGNTALPGNNYMIFDDYRIVAEAVDSIPPYVETVERKADGTFVIRAFGEPGLKYEILVTGDLQHSFSLGTYTMPAGGAFDFEDTSAKTEAVSFYTLVSSP